MIYAFACGYIYKYIQNYILCKTFDYVKYKWLYQVSPVKREPLILICLYCLYR